MKNNLRTILCSLLFAILSIVVLVVFVRAKGSENVPATEAKASETQLESLTEAEGSGDETVEAETSTETKAASNPEMTKKIKPTSATLVAAGDMLMHACLSRPAVQDDGSYDYSYLFAETKEMFSAADIACINNEIIFGGDDRGICDYPLFNGITPLGEAEIAAGIDVITSASNHSLDQKMSGVFNCLSYWQTSHPEIKLLGIHASAEEAATIQVIERNEITFALLNYTYGLNGRTLDEEDSYLVDLMTEETKGKIAEDLARAESMADFVIVFPHWGTEYTTTQTAEQEEWAKFFASCGADLIIGTHPHVPEPVDWITADNGNRALVYYSLGNYVSGQYFYETMLGGIANVTITKDENGTYISSYNMDFLVNHNTVKYSTVRPMFLRDYSDELIAENACANLKDDYYNRQNYGCDFSTEGLKNLARSIYPGWQE